VDIFNEIREIRKVKIRLVGKNPSFNNKKNEILGKYFLRIFLQEFFLHKQFTFCHTDIFVSFKPKLLFLDRYF